MTPEADSILAFAERLLTSRGATVSHAGKDLLEVKLGPELKQKVRRENIVLAFSEEAAAASQEAELATPGSYFFTVLLSLARQRGLVANKAAREKARGVSHFLRQVKFDNFSVEIIDRERYHHVFLRFHFLISYCTVDSTHELRSVLYDVASRRVCSEPDSYWDALTFQTVPPAGQTSRSVGPDELERALREATANVIGKVKHKVFSLKSRSETLLEKELERLESYYRHLILEEGAGNAEVFPRGDNGTNRAESFKLEWQRKAAAEASRFKPRVRVSLVGAEEISVPRCLLTLRADTHPFTEFYGLFDLATATARGAFCQGCSNLFLSLKLHSSGAVLCEQCYGQADKLG